MKSKELDPLNSQLLQTVIQGFQHFPWRWLNYRRIKWVGRCIFCGNKDGTTVFTAALTQQTLRFTLAIVGCCIKEV